MRSGKDEENGEDDETGDEGKEWKDTQGIL